MTPSIAARLFTCALAMALAACGGGDEGRPVRQVHAPEEPLIATPCPDCGAGQLSGVAAAGAPLAGADILLTDGRGATVATRTDAQGRYTLDVQGLTPPFVVAAHGLQQGQPVALHAVVLPAEVGRARIHLTPLTELIATRVLRGLPHELLRAGRFDARHISTPAVREAQAQLQGLLSPLLAAAGLEGPVDLRAGEFQADHAGLDRLLDWLVLSPRDGGYQLAHLLSAPAQALLFDDQGHTDSPPLAAPASTADIDGARQATLEIEARLAELSGLFADGGLPLPAQLAPFLAADFLHDGRGALPFIANEWRRQDPVAQGGFSWQGARWDQPRVLRIQDADHVLVRLRVTPRAPFDIRFETLWMARTAGVWQWRGNHQLAQVRVRQAAVLGPRPLAPEALRAWPGASCALAVRTVSGQSWTEDHCQAAQAGGMLDLGFASEAQAGVVGVFRSQAPGLAARRLDAGARSVLLGTPSASVGTYLLFEIDRQRIDARVAQVRVEGPGLPDAGLSLAPPGDDAPEASHWSWAHHPDDDWPAVPMGWCPDEAPTARERCDESWTQARTGASYRFVLLDAGGQVLETLDAALPPLPPGAGVLQARPQDWFARFDLAPGDPASPTLARLWSADPGPYGGGVPMALPWRAPAQAGARLVEARLALHRVHGTHGGTDTLWQRQALSRDAPGVLTQAWPADPAWLSTWASARLLASDRWGHRYVHALAPHNPH